MNVSPFPEMIVKLTEDLEWSYFVRKDKLIKAVKMPVSFLVETNLGFLPGQRGDYLVEIGPKLRFPCAEKEFLDAYYGVSTSTVGESMDRRVSDRRQA